MYKRTDEATIASHDSLRMVPLKLRVYRQPGQQNIRANDQVVRQILAGFPHSERLGTPSTRTRAPEEGQALEKPM